EFKSKYPNMNSTIQNIADQRRAIVKHNYLPHTTLERLKNDITRNFTHYNSSHPQNNSVHTSVNNSVNTVTLYPPSHHHITSHQTFESSVHNNHSTNITTDLSPNIINPPTDSFQNSQNDIHKVNNNFFFHINFLTKIENEFNKVIESFANTRVE